MTKALISIDYTVDFVADDGKLTAGAPAQAISEAIAQVTGQLLSEEIISFLQLMPMTKEILSTRKVNSFHRTISKELVDAIFMDHWLTFMKPIKRTLESFGWISAIILPFPAQIWIYVCEKEK